MSADVAALREKNGGRYKRIRKRPRREPEPLYYAHKVQCLGELEALNERGLLDLFYGDESGVWSEPCVPYGWQWNDEKVFMPSEKGARLNCFALISRSNHCHFATTSGRIDAHFVIEQFERLSFSIETTTVVVLDNAPIHRAKPLLERRPFWEKRGLFLFYLPIYSPHLNLAEILWRKLKYEWLQPDDYAQNQTLFYRVRQALDAVGTRLKISFSPFKIRTT